MNASFIILKIFEISTETPEFGTGNMDVNLKEDLKKMVRNAELRATGSLLRWKYRKEGKAPPADENIDSQSKLIAEQAHRILSRRGKAIWQGLKEACLKKGTEGDHRD